MDKPIDLSGRRFGRWRVVGYAGNRQWRCICDCGTHRIVYGEALRTSRSKSCGCLRRELSKQRLTTHGMTNTRAHRIWIAMRQRCFNERNYKYADYGGRGITVHESWCRSFEAFFADMGPCPPGYSIDRIDNDGDYEPGNTKWSTCSDQRKNQRPRKKRGIKLNDPEIIDGLKQLNESLARMGRRP
jgi:hypothetical protein